MPQRFLRPGITTSAAWNAVSFPAQSLYIRILTLVDDFGRYDGRVAVLHGYCFPLRPDVKPQQTAAMRSELQKAGLIEVYHVEEKEILQITRWQERARGEKSKYPDKPAETIEPQESAAERSGTLALDASLAITSSPSPFPSQKKNGVDDPLLTRVRSLFRKREGTPLDKSESRAWEHGRKSVEATSPDEWELIEWAFSQTGGKAAQFRRRDMATLLNNWSCEIARARQWRNGNRKDDKVW